MMRQVQRRRLLWAAQDRGEAKLAAVANEYLKQRYKSLQRELRRTVHRKRIAKNLNATGQMFKDGDMDWQAWITSFADALTLAMPGVVTEIYDVEEKFWLTRQMRPAQVDSDKIITAYLQREGRQIKRISEDTRDNTLSMISDWYNTDASLPELIDRLAQFYSDFRAETIARTETAFITSEVSLDMMNQFDVGWWNWDLADEDGEWPCDECRAKAAGGPYQRGDDMPPLHPRDRCGTVYANEDGSELIFGRSEGIGSLAKPVIIRPFWPSLSKQQAEQPRDERGRFTSGGGSYRAVKKHVDAVKSGEEVHHMPAYQANTTMHMLYGPAIRMPKEDHVLTASYGNTTEAIAYRMRQMELIAQGRFREAQQMDIEDLRSKFGNKYDDHIAQMQKYTDKLTFSARSGGRPVNPTKKQLKDWRQ